MTQQTAAPYTVTDLTVPYGEKIAISTNGGGIVTIWYQTGPGVSPPGFYVHDRINNEEVLLGTFAAEQVVRIDTSGSPALYDIGASPSVGSGDADTLKGYSPDATDTADTVVLRDSSGDIQANAFESTVATGTAPLTVASTTVVPNLNADLLDGVQNSAMAHLAGAETFTAKKTFSAGIEMSGSTSNIQLGTNYLSYDGTDAGLTLNSSNYVGLGTNNPSEILQVQVLTGSVSIRFGIADANDWLIKNNSGTMEITRPSGSARLSIVDSGDVTVLGTLSAATVTPADGASGTFTTADAKTVTVTDGIITAIV